MLLGLYLACALRAHLRDLQGFGWAGQRLDRFQALPLDASALFVRAVVPSLLLPGQFILSVRVSFSCAAEAPFALLPPVLSLAP